MLYTAPSTLQVRNLACRRGERLLFSGVAFELAPGAVLWLRGRTGSGKTSLLRMVAGLGRPEHGDILWGGRPAAHAPGYLHALRYVGHTDGLKDDFTAAESLALETLLRGDPASAVQVDEALAALGIAAHRRCPVHTLSQGQRKRLALARLALAGMPGPWLLDEPFDALDADGSERLCAMLAAHQARGGSVLLASRVAPPGMLAATSHCLDIPQ